MKKIKLALSGSGTKFPVFAGAVKRLEEEGCQVVRVIGTSGGSIIAAAIASGLTADQIIKLCQDIMPKLNDMVSLSLFTFLAKWGFDNGEKIQKELAKHLVKTFKETKIPLFVTATNFDTEQTEIFHTTHNPNMEVAKAVRASMSIPIMFTPVEHMGSLYVDGGVKYNFPIDYFKDEGDVVGLYFTDDIKTTRQPRPSGIKAIAEFISRIISMLIIAKTVDDIGDSPNANIIPLTSTANGLDFSFKPEEVNKMIREGYYATDAWIKANPGKLK